MLKSDVLILETSGLSCSCETSNVKFEEDGSLSFLSSWQNCFVSRDSYWEQVVFYPTTNLIELYKIINAEVGTISPVSGLTRAYIVKISKTKSAVLYCCFSDTVVAWAEKLSLWRLTPVTLPLYRHFVEKPGVYQVDVGRFNNVGFDSGIKDSTTSLNQQNTVMLQISDSAMSSLPIFPDDINRFISVKKEEALSIDSQESHTILTKPNLLKYLDWVEPGISYFWHLKKRWGASAKYVFIFIISLLVSFNIGLSVFLLWQNTSLSNGVQEQRAIANQALNATNQLNAVKDDINKINQQLAQNSSKLVILDKLNQLTESDESPNIQSVEIYKSDVKIAGLSGNATNVLSTLIKLNQFTNIKFVSPPVSRGKNQEYFTISFKYEFVDSKEDAANEK